MKSIEGRLRFLPTGGDVLGWVGVKLEVAVVGVAEASFEFGPVVAGCD